MDLSRVLARYRHLPIEIVDKIFNEDFIAQPETFAFYKNEIPKVTFHYNMAKLNQTVSAIYPEYNLPWHYEEFCKDFHHKLKHFRKP